MKVRFDFRGVMPLLMHADNIDAADELDSWRKDPANKNLSVRGDDRSPAWTWQAYLYHDGTRLACPATNIMVALRAAGAQMILKGSKTYKELTQNGMLIPQELCDLTVTGKPVPLAPILALRNETFRDQCQAVKDLGFTLFAKRAKIGQAKNIRVRPRFDSWEVSGVIEVTAREITYDVLQELFALACRQGLMDWRPGCKTPGPYGTFSAKLKKAG